MCEAAHASHFRENISLEIRRQIIAAIFSMEQQTTDNICRSTILQEMDENERKFTFREVIAETFGRSVL
jgi:hypothetical protein